MGNAKVDEGEESEEENEKENDRWSDCDDSDESE